MTNEEAIQMLSMIKVDKDPPNGLYTGIWYGSYGQDMKKALDMAIKALEQSRWILPVERLPEDEAGTYWVCTDSGYQCQCRWTNANPICTYMTTDWHWSIFDVPQYSKVIAWRELPEPYRAESEG